MYIAPGTREPVLLAAIGCRALVLLTLLAACSRAQLPGSPPGDAAIDARDGSLPDARDALLSDAADAPDAPDAPDGAGAADAPLADARDVPVFDASDDGADGGLGCAAPATPGVPDGGVRCGTSSVCDPPRPDGGDCYNIPPYNSATTASAIWVDDPAATGGGYRIALTIGKPVTAAGHTYMDTGNGLIGAGGNGIYGDAVIARDGDTKWTSFHFEGPALYRGAGVWGFEATMTITRAGVTSPAVIGRRYVITRTGSACGNAKGTYTFAAQEPPRACAFGVDLLSLTLPGS